MKYGILTGIIVWTLVFLSIPTIVTKYCAPQYITGIVVTADKVYYQLESGWGVYGEFPIRFNIGESVCTK